MSEPKRTAQQIEVDIALLDVDFNYRTIFEPIKPEDIEGLAASIREEGIIQPLLLRPNPQVPGRYFIVAGERRYRAGLLAGLTKVPAAVRDITRDQVLKVQLTENLERDDTNAITEAAAFKMGMEQLGWDREFLQQHFNRSQGYVSERLTLLEIHQVLPEVGQAVIDKRISVRTASTLRPYLPAHGEKPSEVLRAVAGDMIENGWPAAKALALLADSIRRHSKSLRKYGYTVSPHFEPHEAIFDQTACGECPYRQDRKDDDSLCLQPSCWQKKQTAAYTAWKKGVERERTREREAQEQSRHQTATKVAQRAMASAAGRTAPELGSEAAAAQNSGMAALGPAAGAPVEEFAGQVVKLHTASQIVEDWRKGTADRDKARKETARIAAAFGFASFDELKQWLAGGSGYLDPHTLGVGTLTKQLLQIIAVRREGKTLKEYTALKLQEHQARVASTEEALRSTHLPVPAPALADLTQEELRAATELQAAAGPVWDSIRNPDKVLVYDRECFIRLDHLLAIWEKVYQLGAATRPVQMFSPDVEFSNGISFHGSASQHAVLRLDGEHLMLSCSNGKSTETLPRLPVYYRLGITGTGPGYMMYHVLAIRTPERTVVISSVDHLSYRKDLVTKWWGALNALNSFPVQPEESAGAVPPG